VASAQRSYATPLNRCTHYSRKWIVYHLTKTKVGWNWLWEAINLGYEDPPLQPPLRVRAQRSPAGAALARWHYQRPAHKGERSSELDRRISLSNCNLAIGRWIPRSEDLEILSQAVTPSQINDPKGLDRFDPTQSSVTLRLDTGNVTLEVTPQSVNSRCSIKACDVVTAAAGVVETVPMSQHLHNSPASSGDGHA